MSWIIFARPFRLCLVTTVSPFSRMITGFPLISDFLSCELNEYGSGLPVKGFEHYENIYRDKQTIILE
jgi:hypothetical protein